MTLIERIEQDYIESFKARESAKVDVLRLLKSAVKNEAVKLGNLHTVLDDNQVMAVLNREVKQRKDSIEQYTAGGRPELADKEQTELEIIESYLPKAMDEAELLAVVVAVLSETGVTQKSDMGKVMGALKQKLTNPSDISKAASIVNQKLL